MFIKENKNSFFNFSIVFLEKRVVRAHFSRKKGEPQIVSIIYAAIINIYEL